MANYCAAGFRIYTNQQCAVCGAKADELCELAGSPTPLCEECGQFPMDPPSRLCPGCEAYREHTGAI